jgi:predicted ATPase
LIRQGIAGLLEIGMPLRIGFYTALLAESEEQQGTIVDALETAERAIQAHPDAPVFRPELLRIRGQLKNKQAQMELAEADFRKAIALSQKMSAKAWELRASTSLARLLRDTRRRPEARTMLANIYGWFTEGFDTADLKEAKALLEELSN